MLARSFQLSVLVAFLFGVANANAGLLITEIMYNPESSGEIGEWIEIYNSSPTDSIDLADYDLTDGDGVSFGTFIAPSGPDPSDPLVEYQTLVGTLGPNQIAVLYNEGLGYTGVDYDPDIFFNEWELGTLPEPVLAIALGNWQPMSSSGNSTLKLIRTADSVVVDEVANFKSSPFPVTSDNGRSIFLSGLGTSDTSWELTDPLASYSRSPNAGSGSPLSESDFGSPGIVPLPPGPPATVPEPTSLAIFAGLICGTVGLRRRRSRRES